MTRAAPPPDVFHAIAEPRRRRILELLSEGRYHAVSELVEQLQMPQPAVSKHLAVLRKAGVVSVSKLGRERLYRLDAEKLKPVHAWVRTFERFWTRQVDRIKERAERLAAENAAGGRGPPPPPPSPPSPQEPPC